MTPIPSLPTDNLYKFAAISGLFLFAVGLLAPIVITNSLLNYTAERADKVDTRITEGMIRIGELAQKDELSKEERAAQIQRMADDFAQRIAAEQLLLAKHIGAQKEIANQQIFVLQCAGWVGFAASMLGFAMWYLRVQSLQDRILKLESEKLANDLKPKPKE